MLEEGELIALVCEILAEMHVCRRERVFHLAGALEPQPRDTQGPMGSVTVTVSGTFWRRCPDVVSGSMRSTGPYFCGVQRAMLGCG